MRDSVNKLFQQRFQGHETPVDPGVWQGIQQQMAAAAPAADGVNELFKDRFQGHEMPVHPSAWANISSQLGHTAAAGTAASTMWGWAAAGIVAVVATSAVLLWDPSTPTAPTTVVTMENPTPALELHAPKLISPEEPTTATIAARPAAEKQEASSPRATKAGTHTPGLIPVGEPLEASTTPAGLSSGGSGEGVEGHTVVAEIITDLTEQVIQEPVTAEPEPGLSPKLNVAATREPTTSLGAEVSDAPAAELALPAPKLFMPNTFTPNGDLVNDTYTVGTEGFQMVMIRVYSLKSNVLVFSTNNGEAWTGANCEDGMYMVAAEARTEDGRTITDGKVVWLNRNPTN